MAAKDMILIAHNLRSAHNVGSILRTADGLGIKTVYLSGYTPYPAADPDSRLPHLAARINRKIAKTSLGAENSQPWRYCPNIVELISSLKDDGYEIVALEQTSKATNLKNFKTADKTALLLGREVEGLEDEVLAMSDRHVEIPMQGHKESFNVAVAAAIAAYRMTQL